MPSPKHAHKDATQSCVSHFLLHCCSGLGRLEEVSSDQTDGTFPPSLVDILPVFDQPSSDHFRILHGWEMQANVEDGMRPRAWCRRGAANPTPTTFSDAGRDTRHRVPLSVSWQAPLAF